MTTKSEDTRKPKANGRTKWHTFRHVLYKISGIAILICGFILVALIIAVKAGSKARE